MSVKKKCPKGLKCVETYLYFSLLNTKGSISFSFASNSESDSRRLKVKLAAGSVCRKNKDGIFSRASFDFSMFSDYISCVILYLLLLRVSMFGPGLVGCPL